MHILIYSLKESCLTVAILLHYFFMAAFCCMLSEGVLLFIMLYFVFYNGFFKRIRFFLQLGGVRKLYVHIIYVTRSDKTSLIARKYIHAYNGIYLLFCRCYSNSVSFIELLRIFASYMVKFVLEYCVQKKNY